MCIKGTLYNKSEFETYINFVVQTNIIILNASAFTDGDLLICTVCMWALQLCTDIWSHALIGLYNIIPLI